MRVFVKGVFYFKEVFALFRHSFSFSFCLKKPFIRNIFVCYKCVTLFFQYCIYVDTKLKYKCHCTKRSVIMVTAFVIVNELQTYNLVLFV